MTEPAEPGSKPGVLDRLRARMPWFYHVMRAQGRYTDSKGDFYAAGITYFTIFALFPLLMVGFATGGFVMASRPVLLAEIESKIRSATLSVRGCSSWWTTSAFRSRPVSGRGSNRCAFGRSVVTR